MTLLLLLGLSDEEWISDPKRARLRCWPCLEEVTDTSPSVTGRLHFSSAIGMATCSPKTLSSGGDPLSDDDYGT